MTRKRNMKMTIFLFFLLASGSVVYAGLEEGKLKPVILVLPFENSTGLLKYEPLEKGLRDLIMADLSQQEGITVVDRDKIKAITKELSLKFSGLIDRKHILRIGQVTGANLVLSGGFLLDQDKLIIDAHIYDIATTQLVTSERAQGEIVNIVAIEEELVGKLLKDIDMKSSAIKNREIDNHPSVTLHYIRGLGYYYVGRFNRAGKEFMEALQLNPDFHDARLFRARSYLGDKEYQHCLIELQKLMRLGETYPKQSEAQELSRECEKLLSEEKN
ncbi:MAG: CsgG/HfaB family protein [Candidatus Euphemobacter frigidus]|nr:CsgG/HfaB family protein [Candidatus Euphemobacter frigidus]MDP8276482.1 CsgG/HfaB family protein [Candidatus Euphemobacter frigidus]